jgi:serine/threonine protein kinase
MKALPSAILPSFLCHASSSHEEEIENHCSISQPHNSCTTTQSRLPLHQHQEEEGSFSSCIPSAALQQQQQQQRKAIVTRDLMAVVEAKEAIACRSPSVQDSTTTTQTFDNCYHRHALLGQGTFASVYLCQHLQNRHFYAVKELQVEYHHHHQQQQPHQPQQHYREDEEDDEAGDSPPPPPSAVSVVGVGGGGEGVSVAHREIDALRRLQDGPFIVKLLDVFREEQRGSSSTTILIKYYLILEQQQGGDLMELLSQRRCITEPEARIISRQLLQAIQFCHTKGIAHRDIKPENILLRHSHDETHVVLADFGSARRIPSTSTTTTTTATSSGARFRTLCGTPLYAAPEVFQAQMKLGNSGGDDCPGYYNEQCDLWSAGVVIFALLGGYFPFDGKDEELPTLICEGTIAWVDCYWDPISALAKDLIGHLLQVSVSQRASVYDALDSPWLRRRRRRDHHHQEHCSFQKEQSSCHKHHGSCRWTDDNTDVEEKEECVNPSGVNLWYHHRRRQRNVEKQPLSPPPPCHDHHHGYDLTTTSPMDKQHDSFDSFTSSTTSSDSSSSSNSVASSVLDLYSLASFVTQ